MTADRDETAEELHILRSLIDFINRQVGVYMDCLAGFEGNTVRIHRQIARVLRPERVTNKDGQSVVTYVSLEDPSSPDVIHHRIIRAHDFLNTNAEKGFNEQQVCWAIIVFVFAYWDEEMRPQIARVRGVPTNDVQIEAFGDLRVIRKAIIHNSGVISEAEYRKLGKMTGLFRPNEPVSLSHDEMHRLFVVLKQAIAEIINTRFGHLPGAPDPGQIVDIAIQRGNRS